MNSLVQVGLTYRGEKKLVTNCVHAMLLTDFSFSEIHGSQPSYVVRNIIQIATQHL